ncbi:DUF1330 domain-containing protein [Marinobacter salinisoli]|uniref:DUF1330 domain-containing protein n=1 Tax=Marinobacter salinisoli TaxID=2769486 RepID=UPI001D18111F|nr:DUF1330 domain-containing protein [Marinobacter salinisoli]
MSALNAYPQSLQKVLAETPKDQPVVMLNLKQFVEDSRQPAGAERPARDPIKACIQKASDCVRAVGAEVVWWGSGADALVAPPEESWDQVVLVRYPSIDAYLALIQAR